MDNETTILGRGVLENLLVIRGSFRKIIVCVDGDCRYYAVIEELKNKYVIGKRMDINRLRITMK